MFSRNRPVYVYFLVTAALAARAVFAADIHDSVAELTALDSDQQTMVARADLPALSALAHPDLKINAPTNHILNRDQFLTMMKSGQIRAEAFDRTIESATISGAVGVVMGYETFTPTADRELGKLYGSHPFKRRYTNIYVMESGKWRWLARHANVIVEKLAVQ